MIQQLLANRTTMLMLTGFIIVGGLAAMLSSYRSADDVEHIFDRTENEPDADIFV